MRDEGMKMAGINQEKSRRDAAGSDIQGALPSARGMLGNERGIALILAIVMLMILTIIGIMSISTTTSEMHIAGNDRNNYIALYTADAANDYGQINDVIYTSLTGTVTTWPLPGTGNGTDPNYNSVTVGNQKADVKVQLIAQGPLPPGSGDDPELFQAFYYVVSTSGTGPINAKVRLESQVARIGPK
jgi:type IV pilus assembly protein PilX